MSNLNHVLKGLIDLTPSELKTVIAEAKDRMTKAIRSNVKVGDIVSIPSESRDDTYTVTVINRVNLKIKSNRSHVTYNCPPSLVEIVK